VAFIVRPAGTINKAKHAAAVIEQVDNQRYRLCSSARVKGARNKEFTTEWEYCFDNF
jgi:hypothetical protein